MDVYHIHVTYIREKKSVLYYINVADSLLLAGWVKSYLSFFFLVFDGFCSICLK
jgi:hypothetical protein